MKPVTSLLKRIRVSLALFTALAALPLGSTIQSVEAKPKSGAPAHGYRAKSDSKVKKHKKHGKRRNWRTSRRNDRNTARPNRRNARFDDRRRSDRDYVTRYRTITNSAGERVRQYFRLYR